MRIMAQTLKKVTVPAAIAATRKDSLALKAPPVFHGNRRSTRTMTPHMAVAAAIVFKTDR